MSTQASSFSRECVTSYIDGQWQPAGAHLLDVVNPATEQVVARLSEADAAETDRAVQALSLIHI